MRSLRSLLLTCAVFATAVAALGTASASAATVAGTWSCCGSGGASEQSWTISESGGSLSGSASDSAGTFSPISGSISGTSVRIVTGPYTTDPGYTATFVGTIDGETMSGTWTSNVGGQEGTWSATRTSGPSAEEEAIKKAEEAKKKKEEEEKAAKRKSAIQVNCNSFAPDAPGEYFQCTAQVGDASGRSPAVRPTGSVAFALSSGAGGGFQGASTCALVASQTGGPTSFCAVNYVPPLPGWIPIGSQPAISAAYSGDSVFTPSSGQPQNPISTQNPLSPASVFKALCQEAFSPACTGVSAPPPFISDTCFSLTPPPGRASAADSSCPAGDSGAESVTVSPDEPDLLAYVSCPATSGPLSECELKAYLESPDEADPDLKAKVQAQLNYNSYVNYLDLERAEFLHAVQGGLTAPMSASFQRAQLENSVSLVWTKQINELYEEAAKYGSDVKQQFELSNKWCEHAEPQQACTDYVASINKSLAYSLEVLKQKKIDLGVNVPFTPPSQKAGGASTSRVRNAAKHGPHDAVLAASGTVMLAAGKKTTIRLPIPTLTRAKLTEALRSGRRAITAKLVVLTGTNTGAYAVRTIPVKIKLVAKKPRPAKKKKKKK
jgi:hypothetical protein